MLNGKASGALLNQIFIVGARVTNFQRRSASITWVLALLPMDHTAKYTMTFNDVQIHHRSAAARTVWLSLFLATVVPRFRIG